MSQAWSCTALGWVRALWPVGGCLSRERGFTRAQEFKLESVQSRDTGKQNSEDPSDPEIGWRDLLGCGKPPTKDHASPLLLACGPTARGHQ